MGLSRDAMGGLAWHAMAKPALAWGSCPVQQVDRPTFSRVGGQRQGSGQVVCVCLPPGEGGSKANGKVGGERTSLSMGQSDLRLEATWSKSSTSSLTA